MQPSTPCSASGEKRRQAVVSGNSGGSRNTLAEWLSIRG